MPFMTHRILSKYVATTLLVALLSFFVQQKLSAQVSLSVLVTGIKTDTGHLLFSIYNESSRFPDEPIEYFNIPKELMESDAMEFTFNDLEPGKYAVVVFDDKDSNEELNKNFIGIPKEGYVFSNGAKPKGFKMPTLEQCLVDLTDGPASIRMELIYHKN
jgi:uncharacterized protein (DUF2141 family)